MHRTSAAIACLSWVLLPALPIPGQVERPSVYGNRIEVKLAEGTGAVLHGTRLFSRTGADLDAVQALFDRGMPRHQIDVPMETLDRWHEEVCSLMTGDRDPPGHLGLWFALETETETEARELLADLQRCPLVETTNLEMIPYLSSPPVDNDPDQPPTTPLFTGIQDYMTPAPMGLGVYFAHGFIGGRGRGVIFNHVETDWLLDHEDAAQISLSSLILPPAHLGDTFVQYHGLAGAGIIAADRNNYGINGIADQVQIRFLSWDSSGGIPNAIAQAVLESEPGDVIMLVAQFLLGQRGPEDFVPVEFLQSIYDTILTATSLGRHFVQNAGNGYSDLDDSRYLRRFDLGFRDSGAIMVAATDGSQLTRAGFSNFGSRITANGWGKDVVTIGFGDLFAGGGDPRQTYTRRYSGTSSATPMVAGAVAGLVGAARQQLGYTLTVEEVRTLLREHGTPVTGKIGRRPNLRSMFTSLGILDGLEVDGEPLAPGRSRELIGTGPVGDTFILFASLGLGSTDVGLNRSIHLGLDSLVLFDVLPLTNGVATFELQVPDSLVMRGIDVFLQGVIVDPKMTNPHLTNSVQINIR
jgi:hypothetical protein